MAVRDYVARQSSAARTYSAPLRALRRRVTLALIRLLMMVTLLIRWGMMPR